MASLTYADARDEILTLFKDAWDAGADSAGVRVQYPDVAEDPPPETEETNESPSPWARVTVEHASGGQDTLMGSVGNRRFRRDGTVRVQIFTAFGQGLSLADSLAKIAADAFEGQTTPNDVWFRNVRLNELGRDGEYSVTQVLADFTYDEVK